MHQVPRPELLDHLLFVAIMLAWPLLEAFWYYPRSVRAIAAGRPGARMVVYRNLLVPMWGFTAAIVVLWLTRGRAWGLLFVRLGTPLQSVIGLAIVAGFLAFLWLQLRRVWWRPEVFPALRRQMDFIAPLMARTETERRGFRAVAVSAGITEELMVRGFVFWYLSAWAGPVLAVVAGSLLFGLGHLYLGRQQVPKTAIAGLVGSLVVLASGSLWPAVIVHAAVDLGNGELGYRVFTQPSAPAASAA